MSSRSKNLSALARHNNVSQIGLVSATLASVTSPFYNKYLSSINGVHDPRLRLTVNVVVFGQSERCLLAKKKGMNA